MYYKTAEKGKRFQEINAFIHSANRKVLSNITVINTSFNTLLNVNLNHF